MEFLGDSVLGVITAAWLFERFADEPEGLLTLRKAAIVNDAAARADRAALGVWSLLRLGAGMRAAGGADNTSVLADAFEAFVAALYLRYGLERARRFVIARTRRASRSFHGRAARCEDAPAALRAGASRRYAGLPRDEPRHAAASGVQLARERQRQDAGNAATGPRRRPRSRLRRRPRCSTDRRAT